MNKTDFTHPQRMSIGAFFIIFIKLVIRSFAPIATLAVYSILRSSSAENFSIWTILICLGCWGGISLIWALISYLPKKFYIKDGNLIFIHGLINHEDTCIPLDRVHSLRTERGIWFRLLGMRGIIFDTVATKQEEVELILDENDWRRLLSLIEEEEKPQRISSSVEPPEYNPSSKVCFPIKNLLLAALCQNHLKGMAVLGSLFAIIFSNLGDLPENTTHTMLTLLEAYFEGLTFSPLKVTLLLAIIYIVVLLLWLGRILMRYFDMTMKYDKKLLTFTYGLLNRSSCRFLHNKICTIWIKRNFLERKFGFSTLMLKQAFNVTADKEEENMKLYGTDNSKFFLSWWLGKDYDEDPDIITAKSGKGVFFRSVSIRILISIIVSIVLCHDQLYLWLIAPLAYIVLSLYRGMSTMRHSRISLKSSYFIVHNGAFAEMKNYIKYSNLEVVKIRRTPFTKWFHRVTIILSTPGTFFSVRSIKEEDAKLIQEYLLLKAEE